MRLLLLLVAIYSLIFYQHYKITKSKTLLSGAKLLSATEQSLKFSLSQQQDKPVITGLFTASHSLEYKNSQWKPKMAGYILPTSKNR